MKPEKRVSELFWIKNEKLHISSTDIKVNQNEKFWVIGAGKASARMAAGLEFVAAPFIRAGMIIAPKGLMNPLRKIQLLPGSHPKPDENSRASALEIIDFCKYIPVGSTVVCLISGGASSLMETPEEGLKLEDIGHTYEILLKSGASIHEMNIVRKHLSAVKGGKLLPYLKGKKVVNILLSDIPGNEPRHIGSGPTNPEPSTPKDALTIIEKFGIQDKIPSSILHFLREKSVQSKEIESTQVINIMAGTSYLFAQKAAELLEKKGWKTHVDPQAYNAPIEEVANTIVETVQKSTKGKQAYLFHGESTVRVTGNGKGGRNQHLALLLAQKLNTYEDVMILSAGTDGTDGPTDAAGAILDCSTMNNAMHLGLNMKAYTDNFDAYHFFNSLDALIFTGPTGNNLMDFQLILINK